MVQWLEHVANGENLKKFTEATAVYIMNEPREGKPLLVLDLDHTLLDFSSKTLQRDVSTDLLGAGTAAAMKRYVCYFCGFHGQRIGPSNIPK